MQISQTFNIIVFISIVLPHYFYQRFINTLPGTILHICITLIFRLSVQCLYNIFDIYTSNYWKRNSTVLIVTSFYCGYKHYSTFRRVIIFEFYPTLKTFIIAVLFYTVEIYYPTSNWCTDLIRKYKNKLCSSIRVIIQHKLVVKSCKIIKYDKVLGKNVYDTMIVIFYIISFCESHDKVELSSMKIGELSPRIDLFTRTAESNSKLLLRTAHILGLLLDSMNRLF